MTTTTNDVELTGVQVSKQDCVSIIREHWTLWQSMMPARHTQSFPLFSNHYFNISGLLPCCKKMKNVLLWGPCSAEHAHSFIHWTTWPAMGRCALHTTRSLAVSHMRHQRRVANMLNMPKSASDMGCVMPTVQQSSKARETAESTRVTTARHNSRLPRMPLPPEHNNVHHVIHEFTLYYTTAGLWSRSRRLGLETYQRLVSVSSRSRIEKNCQRLGLVSVSAIYVSCPRPIFGQIVQATVRSVNGL